jgi:hypothetical protein
VDNTRNRDEVKDWGLEEIVELYTLRSSMRHQISYMANTVKTATKREVKNCFRAQ